MDREGRWVALMTGGNGDGRTSGLVLCRELVSLFVLDVVTSCPYSASSPSPSQSCGAASVRSTKRKLRAAILLDLLCNVHHGAGIAFAFRGFNQTVDKSSVTVDLAAAVDVRYRDQSGLVLKSPPRPFRPSPARKRRKRVARGDSQRHHMAFALWAGDATLGRRFLYVRV